MELLTVAPEELAGFAEVMKMLGVSRRTAQKYIATSSFPEPFGRIAAGPVWLKADVEAWGSAHLPMKRGRPRKNPGESA